MFRAQQPHKQRRGLFCLTFPLLCARMAFTDLATAVTKSRIGAVINFAVLDVPVLKRALFANGMCLRAFKRVVPVCACLP